ncbi:hypothetical protein NDU88_001223 [Pleurodeles waltl]|uniref:Uncharacterized protein n=1 Tax=Pleurodeles waltl TaxID=8319 RepID=A0AAV7VYT6_PLEWA|nr:hypothetical protein NDU88_001223 [Pleurodeles waltl]
MGPKVVRGSRVKPGSQDRRSSHPLLLTRGGASRSGSDGSTGRQSATRTQGTTKDNHTALDQIRGHEKDATKLKVTPSSLALIYETIMAQHKQTQGDSKKVRVATKQLQVAVSKIAKSCSEIGERNATMEARADVFETELGAVAQQAGMHDTQLVDIQ